MLRVDDKFGGHSQQFRVIADGHRRMLVFGGYPASGDTASGDTAGHYGRRDARRWRDLLGVTHQPHGPAATRGIRFTPRDPRVLVQLPGDVQFLTARPFSPLALPGEPPVPLRPQP